MQITDKGVVVPKPTTTFVDKVIEAQKKGNEFAENDSIIGNHLNELSAATNREQALGGLESSSVFSSHQHHIEYIGDFQLP